MAGNIKEVFMTNNIFLWKGILIYALVCAMALSGCDGYTGGGDGVLGGGSKPNSISLAENTWADGAITSLNKEQWFKFTATAGTHYLHVSFGTLTDLYAQLFDSSNNPMGNQTRFNGSGSGYAPLTVTSGKAYYIKITPYSDDAAGTYRIAFNATQSPPLPPGVLSGATALIENAWTNGAITSSNNEQWFKFTANAATHYLHISFVTLTDLYAQVYDSSGATVGSRTRLNSAVNQYPPLAVTSGEEYYVKVTPYSSSGTGAYQLAFNTSGTAP
jgi:predicted RNA-binding protein with TRAM domain